MKLDSFKLWNKTGLNSIQTERILPCLVRGERFLEKYFFTCCSVRIRKSLVQQWICYKRLRHICSTIFYIKHFGFSSPSALVDSFQTFQCSIEYLEKLDNRTKPTQPPGLKLEDLIRFWALFTKELSFCRKTKIF